MAWLNAWMVLYVGSGLIQLAGLAIAGWYWRAATAPGWRCFWGAFFINWVVTVLHQLAWGYSTELAIPMGFLQGIFKLAAMLAEIVVMLIAADLERPGEGRW